MEGVAVAESLAPGPRSPGLHHPFLTRGKTCGFFLPPSQVYLVESFKQLLKVVINDGELQEGFFLHMDPIC